MNPPLPFSMKIPVGPQLLEFCRNHTLPIKRKPWWLFPGAVLMLTTTLIRDVAWETCQCRPVADADAGICVRSMTTLRTDLKKLFWLTSMHRVLDQRSVFVSISEAYRSIALHRRREYRDRHLYGCKIHRGFTLHGKHTNHGHASKVGSSKDGGWVACIADDLGVVQRDQRRGDLVSTGEEILVQSMVSSEFLLSLTPWAGKPKQVWLSKMDSPVRSGHRKR